MNKNNKPITFFLLIVMIFIIALSGCTGENSKENVAEKSASQSAVTLSTTTAEVRTGEELQLSVQGADSQVKWISDNEKVATVDEQGTVSAVGQGKATITAEVQGRRLSCVVTVNNGSDEKIADIIDKMTVEEKVGQLFMAGCYSAVAINEISEIHPGGFILFGDAFSGKTAEEISSTIKSYQENSDIPMIISADEEGGTVVRVSSNPALRETPFLSPAEVYKNGGWNGVKADVYEKADLLLSLGVNVNMAPVCDVTSDDSAFMSSRSFSGNVEEVCRYTEICVRLSQEKNLGTVLKHFPGYGNCADTHTGIAYDNRPYSDFEKTDFKPFITGIKNGADCVLISHNIVKSMDENTPASLSPEVVGILRNDLEFNGVIMTDDLDMGAVREFAGQESAVVAVKAGVDMLCCSEDVKQQYNSVLSAVKSGEISLEQVEKSVERILRWKSELGLIE